MRENRTHGSEGGETVSSRPLSGLDRCVRYVNSKGGWYYAAGINGGDRALGCGGCYGNQGTGTKNRPPTVFSALFSLLSATSRNPISSWPATVCRQNQVSTWRLDGAAPVAWAASPYSAFTSSHRNRSASAGVSCPTTLGSSPARNRAANAGHAGGDWKLKPTVVRPKRACACRHRGMINASSAANDAAQASGVAGIAVSLGSAGGCQPGVSCRPGGSSAKSSRITGPSVCSSSRNAASTMRRWNALSSGSPTGRPSCADVHRPRGGRVFSICARTEPNATVAIPRSSSMWASAHTARVQRGQTGLSRTASIRSCRNCPAIWSAASVMPAGSVEPITV